MLDYIILIFALSLAYCDFRYRELPAWQLAIFGLAIFFRFSEGVPMSDIPRQILQGGGIFLAAWVLYQLGDKWIGGGDVKLLGLIGASFVLADFWVIIAAASGCTLLWALTIHAWNGKEAPTKKGKRNRRSIKLQRLPLGGFLALVSVAIANDWMRF
jgi:Flp pilus assembly protein protease CpaA